MAKKKGTPNVSTRTVTALLASVAVATLAGSTAYVNKAQAEAEGLLVDPALIEINEAIANPAVAGEFAARASQAGIELYNSTQTPAGGTPAGTGEVAGADTAGASASAPGAQAPGAGAVTPAAKQTFTLDADVALPTARRTKTSSPKYPFEEMEVGQSFFVAATEKDKEPAKGLASTVAFTNSKYAVQKKDPTTGALLTREGNKREKDKTTGKFRTWQEQVPDMELQRKYVVRAVDETAQGRGKGARVWREA